MGRTRHSVVLAVLSPARGMDAQSAIQLRLGRAVLGPGSLLFSLATPPRSSARLSGRFSAGRWDLAPARVVISDPHRRGSESRLAFAELDPGVRGRCRFASLPPPRR